MKRTSRDRQRHVGEPCTICNNGENMFCSFTALSSVRRMAAGDRDTAAATGAERLESSESVGRSAKSRS